MVHTMVASVSLHSQELAQSFDPFPRPVEGRAFYQHRICKVEDKSTLSAFLDHIPPHSGSTSLSVGGYTSLPLSYPSSISLPAVSQAPDQQSFLLLEG